MIPIGTDRRLKHTPWINYAVVAANIFIFIVLQQTRSNTPAVRAYLLQPDRPEVYQFFSSMFMHAGWWHLIGNMIFLWVFGNAVNDSLGNVGYLAFYLAGGVIAGVGYVLLSGTAPVLGASGAISAVTGAFLVLFPRVRVTVLVPLFYILMPFEVSSLLFLLLQFGWNLYASMTQPGGGVAYVAHSSGYVFGIVVVAGFLAIKVLPREPYDLLSMIRTWCRRRSYTQVVAGGYDPFSRTPSRPARRWIGTRTTTAEAPTGPEAKELELRKQISADHARGDLASAAEGYLKLTQITDEALLPMNQQLDVSNYLMSVRQYPAAAGAYEQFLKHYANYEYIGDIRLMLGLIYGRYLHQDKKAEIHLNRAIPLLRETSKVDLARSELAEIDRRLG
ncbi:MAG: rhomboid family intramembrane serine protease [Planctomycetota bacterium]|nr:rhomboid family intramembrane serine protease [Planctomycetota bacterium]